jgi:hypothetical protein
LRAKIVAAVTTMAMPMAGRATGRVSGAGRVAVLVTCAGYRYL